MLPLYLPDRIMGNVQLFDDRLFFIMFDESWLEQVYMIDLAELGGK